MANLLALVGATTILVMIPGPNVALKFNAAFLPQFIVDNGSITGQLALVATVFLAVLFFGDIIWAATAASARQLLDRYASARNRITGGFLVAAGVGLALSRRNI